MFILICCLSGFNYLSYIDGFYVNFLFSIYQYIQWYITIRIFNYLYVKKELKYNSSMFPVFAIIFDEDVDIKIAL